MNLKKIFNDKFQQRRFCLHKWCLRSAEYNGMCFRHMILHTPYVGAVVEDCRYQVHTVVKVEDEDTVILDDGYRCSWYHCCDLVETE